MALTVFIETKAEVLIILYILLLFMSQNENIVMHTPIQGIPKVRHFRPITSIY